MNLVVDFGNTLVKLAVFDKGELVAQRCMERLHPSVLEELLSEWPVRRAVVASTRGEVDDVAAMLRRRVDYLLEFTSQTSVPIGNAYLTPETLGRDRLAAAVGENVLIVDFGTAVTIDLVTADNTFRGGCISPGVTMRFRALHDYTAKLPLCAATGGEGLSGLTTEEAIELGVMNGIAFEIEGYVTRMREKIDGLRVIFTGGDAKFFVKRIKNTIFAHCDLVFLGLNRILEYNASEESRR